MIPVPNRLAAGGPRTREGFAVAGSNSGDEAVRAREHNRVDYVGCLWLKAVQREAQVIMMESRTAWEAVISSRP